MGSGGSTLSAEEMKAAKDKDITVEEAEALKAEIAKMRKEAQNLKAENAQLLAKEEAQMFTFGVSHVLVGTRFYRFSSRQYESIRREREDGRASTLL